MPELANLQQTREEQIRAVLAELGGQILNDDGILHEGSRIVIPTTMSKKDAAKAILRNVEAEDEEVHFVRNFKYRPWDGARAFANVVKKHLGLMTQVGVETPFGKIPPDMITINVGVNKTEQVPWGEIQLPIFPDSRVVTGVKKDPELGPVFALHFYGPKKYKGHAQGLFKLVEEELHSNSLYRGKAFDGAVEPNFIDLSRVDPHKVVYSEEVITQLDANVWSLLEHSEAQRREGLSLRRAVLLKGPYGTGKTLAGTRTAQIAVANGWTFVYARPGRDDLDTVLQTARMYQPAVVFFEDLDEIADPGQEDSFTKLLDTFDGITVKGVEIIAMVTTNHPDRIHKGMFRPGRLDAVIDIGALDASGVGRMIRALVPPGQLGALDVAAVHNAMSDFMPAFVVEAITRARRYSLARNNGKVGKLSSDDFIAAAIGLRPQLDMMNGGREHQKVDRLTDITKRLVTDVVRENIDDEFLVVASA
jgi:hypothetical protein